MYGAKSKDEGKNNKKKEYKVENSILIPTYILFVVYETSILNIPYTQRYIK